MNGEGGYCCNKVLPFGLRSARFFFNLLSDAMEWILLNECLICFVCHIFDAPTSPLAYQQSLSSMLLTFRNPGFPIAPNKTEGPFSNEKNFHPKGIAVSYCRFLPDVTQIQTTKLLILLIFYFNEV